MPSTKTAPKPAKTAKATKPTAARMTLKEVMSLLEKAGSAQTKKTYARHGVDGPMFGVSFAFLKTLYKKIKVDHELALSLWNSGNFDARNLAVKIVDPSKMSSADLDQWAATKTARMCGGYVAFLTAETSMGKEKAEKWLRSSDGQTLDSAWTTVGALAMINETIPDSWFAEKLAQIEKTIQSAPNTRRYAMNQALIQIGCRNATLRKAAEATAKRIGTVEIDHGDTSCQTPAAVEYIGKCWDRSKAMKFESPAAHERSRESMRTRC